MPRTSRLLSGSPSPEKPPAREIEASMPSADNAHGRRRTASYTPAQPHRVCVQHIAQLGQVRYDLGLYLEDRALPEGTAYDVLTCVQEASKNALRFGATRYGVQISLAVAGDEVVVTVRDHGPGLDLELLDGSPPDPLGEAGRGLFLLLALMDDVEVRVDGGTEVRLRKKVPGRAEEQSRVRRVA
jgi:anti-sigma regulatory factor (Ser/Thr protein kinase)